MDYRQAVGCVIGAKVMHNVKTAVTLTIVEAGAIGRLAVT